MSLRRDIRLLVVSCWLLVQAGRVAVPRQQPATSN
jgi:hypothetical protein